MAFDPKSIIKDSWCMKCYMEETRLTIEKMQLLAQEKGGTCLSKKYINVHTKLRWRCAKGHEWNAIPNSIIKGTW